MFYLLFSPAVRPVPLLDCVWLFFVFLILRCASMESSLGAMALSKSSAPRNYCTGRARALSMRMDRIMPRFGILTRFPIHIKKADSPGTRLEGGRFLLCIWLSYGPQDAESAFPSLPQELRQHIIGSIYRLSYFLCVSGYV